jgi:hypothetical protein
LNLTKASVQTPFEKEQGVQMRTKVYHDPDRIYEEEFFSGTAMSYAMTDDGFANYPVDYELASIEESYPEEMRARALKERTPVGRAPVGKLQDELVKLFGPSLSAKRAVELLGGLARKMERDGLVIGRDRDGDFVHEAIDGKTSSS